MFELELLNLLNEYKQSTSEYDRNKTKNSIKKLISENCEKLESFLQKPEIEPWAKALLNECEISCKEPQKIKETKDDFEIIKNAFQKWSSEYNANNKTLTQANEKIIDDIINFYLPARLETIEEILKIQDTQDWEDFKGHLSNALRAHYAKKLSNYMESENYNSLSFFQKIKKKSQLQKIAKDLANYKCDSKLIEETIK